MARATFRAELRSSGSGGGGHLVEVPDDVIAKLGGKGRTPVTATFDGVPYRGSIVKMRGITMIGVTKAIMTEAGVGTGDTLTVVVENDDAPREVEVPADLAKVFRGARDAKAEWDRLAFTRQREYAEAILDAKEPETRPAHREDDRGAAGPRPRSSLVAPTEANGSDARSPTTAEAVRAGSRWRLPTPREHVRSRHAPRADARLASLDRSAGGHRCFG